MLAKTILLRVHSACCNIEFRMTRLALPILLYNIASLIYVHRFGIIEYLFYSYFVLFAVIQAFLDTVGISTLASHFCIHGLFGLTLCLLPIAPAHEILFPCSPLLLWLHLRSNIAFGLRVSSAHGPKFSCNKVIAAYLLSLPAPQLIIAWLG